MKRQHQPHIQAYTLGGLLRQVAQRHWERTGHIGQPPNFYERFRFRGKKEDIESGTHRLYCTLNLVLCSGGGIECDHSLYVQGLTN